MPTSANNNSFEISIYQGAKIGAKLASVFGFFIWLLVMFINYRSPRVHQDFWSHATSSLFEAIFLYAIAGIIIGGLIGGLLFLIKMLFKRANQSFKRDA